MAREADLTTSAAYRIWERQEDFHLDLAVAAVRHREMRPPFGIEALSHALAALSEGFAMQTMSGVTHLTYELEETDPLVGRDWTLLGIAVEALVDRLTVEV